MKRLLDDATSGIICNFDRSQISPEKLSKGDDIKIKGVCTGYLMDIVLNRCALVD